MNLTLKQGDTRHAIRARIKNKDGVSINLSQATVSFSMKHYLKDFIIKKEVAVDESGMLHLVFQDGETDVSGKYHAEFTVTYFDDRVETFPSEGYIVIKIEEKVGDLP